MPSSPTSRQQRVLEIPDSPPEVYEVIHIPDSPKVVDLTEPAENLRTLTAFLPSHRDYARKIELHKILDAFQLSDDYGVYVCEAFRDSRRTCIDHYWDEVEDQASGLSELRQLVGKSTTPLLPEARAKLSRFGDTLRRLSERIDAALGHH